MENGSNRFCTNCGAQIGSGQSFCNSCGAKLSIEPEANAAAEEEKAFDITCPHCGGALLGSASIAGLNVECPYCSKTFTAPAAPAEPPAPQSQKTMQLKSHSTVSTQTYSQNKPRNRTSGISRSGKTNAPSSTLDKKPQKSRKTGRVVLMVLLIVACAGYGLYRRGVLKKLTPEWFNVASDSWLNNEESVKKEAEKLLKEILNENLFDDGTQESKMLKKFIAIDQIYNMTLTPIDDLSERRRTLDKMKSGSGKIDIRSASSRRLAKSYSGKADVVFKTLQGEDYTIRIPWKFEVDVFNADPVSGEENIQVINGGPENMADWLVKLNILLEAAGYSED